MDNSSIEPKKLTKPFMFEWVSGQILKKHYKLEGENILEIGKSKYYDFKASNGILFEVKYVNNGGLLDLGKILRNSLVHIPIDIAQKLVIVSNITVDLDISESLYEFGKYRPKLITLENLLYLCGDDDNLRSELLLCINQSTENIVPMPLSQTVEEVLKPAKIKNEEYENNNQTTDGNFKYRLKEINPGNDDFNKFENFCVDFISKIFQDNIEKPIPQLKNNRDLYRFDIIASIKENPSSFWKFIYDKYNSLFILFECKNYSGPITQNEIYTTERYLFDNALRNVAIIFTRKGMTKNALIAAQGILKEHGKLILVLDDKDIIQLEKLHKSKCNGETSEISPSQFLLEKAKDFLIKLDK